MNDGMTIRNDRNRTQPRPRPRACFSRSTPYVPGQSSAPGAAKVFKLSSNETPLGPSPLAKEAFRAFADHLEAYPGRHRHGLCARRSARAMASIRPGSSAARARTRSSIFSPPPIIGPGDEGIFTAARFSRLQDRHPRGGRRSRSSPEEINLTANVDAILAKVGPRTKMVFLANPNNPTGTYLPFAEVERLAVAPARRMCCSCSTRPMPNMSPRADYSSGLELVTTSENVVMTRTFSKIYGLAGIRLGWGYAPLGVCDALNRIRTPFNTNGAAIAAGIAALADHAHIEKAIAHNETWLAWLTSEISALGIKVTPSVGNFLLLHFTDAAEARAADDFSDAAGLILRAVDAYGLPHCLRLTVGTEEANRLVVASLTDFVELEGARACLTVSGLPLGEPLFQPPRAHRHGADRLLPRARLPAQGARARDRRRRYIGRTSAARCANSASPTRSLRRAADGGRGRRSRHSLRAGRRDGSDRARRSRRIFSRARSSPMSVRLRPRSSRRSRRICPPAFISFRRIPSPEPSNRVRRPDLRRCFSIAGRF